MSNQNFSPEGHNGGHGAREQGAHHAHEHRRDARPEPEPTHDYDDGLVHDHSWARSSNDR